MALLFVVFQGIYFSLTFLTLASSIVRNLGNIETLKKFPIKHILEHTPPLRDLGQHANAHCRVKYAFYQDSHVPCPA